MGITAVLGEACKATRRSILSLTNRVALALRAPTGEVQTDIVEFRAPDATQTLQSGLYPPLLRRFVHVTQHGEQRGGSTGRPGHGAPTEHVKVEMEHRLARLRSDVGDDPIAVAKFGLVGDLAHRAEQLRQQISIGCCQCMGIRNVAPRNDENVSRRLWRDIAEGDDVVILVNPVRRDLVRHDLAEETIGHDVSLGEVAGARQDDRGRGHGHGLRTQNSRTESGERHTGFLRRLHLIWAEASFGTNDDG